MMKRILAVVFVVCCGAGYSVTDSMAAERIINIPTASRFEKVGEFQGLRLPDGSRVEMRRVLIHDGTPIKDNVFGECEAKFYDQAGRVQEGKGYLIMDPAEGKLEGGKVKIPVKLRFVPVR